MTDRTNTRKPRAPRAAHSSRPAASGQPTEAPEQSLSPDERLRWTRIGLLAALAMALGYLESFIPLPLPGLKLGLANIAILIALAQDEVAGAFFIGVVKVLAAGLLFGNPVSMAFSAAGTLLAFIVMAPLSRIPSMQLPMVSVVGALLHEVGQLAVAAALLGTPLVWYSAPLLLLGGCITGLACGFIAQRTVRFLEDEGVGTPQDEFALTREGASGSTRPAQPEIEPVPGPEPEQPQPRPLNPPTRPEPLVRVPAKPAIACFLVYTVAMLHAESVLALGVGLALAAVACVVGRVGPSLFARMLAPLAAILLITLIAQVANTQHLEAAFVVGPTSVSHEALRLTATMFARLLAISAASLALMAMVPTSDLVDAVRWLMRPLERIGVRTQGPVLALETALQAVPLLAASLRETFATTARRGETGQQEPPASTGDLWREVIPRFIADAYRTALTSR